MVDFNPINALEPLFFGIFMLLRDFSITHW